MFVCLSCVNSYVLKSSCVVQGPQMSGLCGWAIIEENRPDGAVVELGTLYPMSLAAVIQFPQGVGLQAQGDQSFQILSQSLANLYEIS